MQFHRYLLIKGLIEKIFFYMLGFILAIFSIESNDVHNP